MFFITAQNEIGGDEKKGWCLDSKGRDQNRGQRKIAKRISKEDCWRKCQTERATGCEWNGDRSTCYRHTGDVASGGGASYFRCLVLKK